MRRYFDHLRIRISVVRKAVQQLDMRIWPLEDQELLQLFARCLVPGNAPPTFVPELVDERIALKQHKQRAQREQQRMPSVHGHPADGEQKVMRTQRTNTTGNERKRVERPYQKQLRGIHGTFSYTSAHAQDRYEAGILEVADLLAPSAVTIAPDVLEIQAGAHTRYTRTFTVTGYGHHLLCGWINTLHDLGLPLLVSSHVEPIDSRLMMMKLEQALTKLESQRLSDQKMLRLTKADQNIEVRNSAFTCGFGIQNENRG